MARIEPLTSQQSLVVRALNALTRRRYGQAMASVGVVARSPHLLLPYLMTASLAHGKTQLPGAVRSLAMHYVAVVNGCAWCIDFGAAQSVKAGVAPGKLQAIQEFPTDPRFTPAERAALSYAAAVTAGNGHVDDATFDALRPHFSERAIVELTLAVAIEHFFNRVNGPLELAAQGFCPVPWPAAPLLPQSAALPSPEPAR